MIPCRETEDALSEKCLRDQPDGSAGKGTACLQVCGLTSIPRTYMGEGRTNSCKLSSALHISILTCVCAHKYVRAHTRTHYN